MHDPHVETIHYKVGSVETISYDNPKPMTFSNHLGRIFPVERQAPAYSSGALRQRERSSRCN